MITLDQAGAGCRGLSVWSPPQAYRDVVEHGCLLRHDPCPIPPSGWRIVPDVSAHLLAAWDGPTRGWKGTLVGARRVFVDNRSRVRRAVIAVRLAPGVLPGLFGDRADLLTDRGIALTDLGRTAWSRRRGGVSPQEAAHRLQALGPRQAPEAWSTLMALVPPADTDRWVGAGPAILSTSRSCGGTPARDRTVGLDWRVRGALAAARDARPGLATPSRIAHALGVSSRTLRRTFQEHVGLSLQRALRIQRLYGALHRLRESAGRVGTDTTHAQVAFASGYTDQSHMIRDFHELLGETPSAWMSRRQLG